MTTARAKHAAILAAALTFALVVIAVVPGGESYAQRKSSKIKSPRDTSKVLVKIGKDGITRYDVEQRIEALPEQFRKNYSTPDGRKRLLDRMVEENVWLSLALDAGVSNRAEIKQQIEQQRRDLLIRTYINELMASNPAPSDSEAMAVYESNLDEYKLPATITLRHIMTATERDAKRVLQWANRKYDWNKLVKQYSKDELTVGSGGSLGTVTAEGVFSSLGAQPALAESAFTVAAGDFGGPFQTDRGWHVIRVDAVKEESVRPFDQVRQIILRQISSQRSQDFYQTSLGSARSKLGVEPDSSAIEQFLAQRKSARDMFNEAQTIGPAQERIAAYQGVLDAHPNSEVSPQAQFMIGFIHSEELKDFDKAEGAFRLLLERYPKAELAASAQWMIDHMRSSDVPAFVDLDADSTGVPEANKESDQR